MSTFAAKALSSVALIGLLAFPAGAESPTFKANPPESILTPDKVETSIGTLTFRDGAPDEKTVQLAYDQIDLARGIESFMKGMPATSVFAFCRAMEEVGVKANQGVGITENLMDARSLFLTPNTTTPYNISCMDLSGGPVVAEIPPGVLGTVDDGYFRWLNDVGVTGPDQGRGGRYLFLPPGYTGPVPEMGFHVMRASTNRLLMFYRAFVKNGDIKAAVDGVKAAAKLYPLADAKNPPPTDPPPLKWSDLRYVLWHQGGSEHAKEEAHA